MGFLNRPLHAAFELLRVLMMDIENLRIFTEVARQQSFSKAARVLQLPSSNVSARVQKLELQLGVQLLHRSTRQIRLTEIGKSVFKSSVDILSIEASMYDLAAGEAIKAQGKLRIAAPSSLSRQYLGDWLIEFKRQYPDVQPELLSSNQRLDFYEYDLDFAFRQGPLPDSNQYAKKLVDIKFGLYASPQLMAQQACTSLGQLKTMPCVFGGAVGKIRPWRLFDPDLNEYVSFKGPVSMLLDDAELIYKAAKAGHGVAYLAQSSVESATKDGCLLPLLPECWPEPSPMYLVYQEKKSISIKHQYFIDFIQSKCQTVLR